MCGAESKVRHIVVRKKRKPAKVFNKNINTATDRRRTAIEGEGRHLRRRREGVEKNDARPGMWTRKII